MSDRFCDLLRLLHQDCEGFGRQVKDDESALDETGPHNETLLHFLAVERRADLVKVLAELGANVEPTNEFGSTPLMDCALIGNLAMVKLLLELGADPNFQSPENRRTALHWAAESGKEETLHHLIGSGGNPRLKDDQGETAVDLLEWSKKWGKPFQPPGFTSGNN